MRFALVSAFLIGAAIADEVHVTLAPSLDPSIPPGVPVIQDAPLAVAEPIILPEDLEERQDTVVRQTASSGKLQHILRAHYVGQLDNEQTFEAQDAAEPAALPKTPRVSLNELYFAQQQPAAAAPAASALPYPYSAYPPYPYGGYPYPGVYPYGAAAPFAAPAAVAASPARV